MAENPLWPELDAFCRAFEGAEEASPWENHVDFRVKGKTFVFTSGDRPVLTLSAKPLPETREMFLQLPGVKVAAYVGRFGWLSMSVTDEATLGVAKDMIAESYAQMAKKKRTKAK